MKLKKVMLMAALAAAIGSVNMVTALADENETETKYGWEGSGNTWRYYDSNGNLKSGWIKAEDGDGRGNDVWYYIDPSTNLMIYNTTRTIDGVSYTFSDDGSWVVPVQTAPKGHVTGGEYAAIGRPSLTHDLYMSTDFGDVEVYYLNMKDKQDMDAQTFANTLAGIEKGQKGQATTAETVTIANQQYSKVTVSGKKTSRTYYCRKQDGYMVVVQTTGRTKDVASLNSIVMSMTTAQ